MSDHSSAIYAAIVFAPVMGCGAYILYLISKIVLKEAVLGEENSNRLSTRMQIACVQGILLSFIALGGVMLVQRFVGSDYGIQCIAVFAILLGIMIGGSEKRKWEWMWRFFAYFGISSLFFMAGLIS